ncbi:hypothetical protein CKM354_001062800 [Cercospora kikuchii]|uniref:BTB domain-containing protein n=1 Tax=Cercospora kikuchii TaxID=84275 RepID=A0A9P3CRD3_9PEZI|nr:uncharacterized protein CKM354_001062800 [Cercospora kikuchii]GIZ47539.1 hypothetical protein CKM354_001062800 [Cercospora kikuchii]
MTSHRGITHKTPARVKESYEKVARLPEVDAGIFQIYITYVYSGNIVISKYGGEEVYSNDNDPEGIMRFQVLIQLYSLANYLQDSNLKNKIIDYLMGPNELPALCPSTATINLAFATNSVESTLCQLLIDTSLYSCDPAILKDEWYHLPEGFIRGLSLGWAEASWNKGMTIEKPSTVARCKYHEHDEETLADEEGTCGLRGVAKATPKKKGRKPRNDEDESTGACAPLLRSSNTRL